MAKTLLDIGKPIDRLFYGKRTVQHRPISIISKMKPVTRQRKKPSRSVPLKKVKHFHRQKHKIPKIILGKVDKKEIIYGARALNKRFPKFLDKPTQDYDIFSTHPKKDAREAERALDKGLRGDHFFVKPALHPGNFKVIAHVTNEGYADYTKPDETIPFDIIDGKKYVKLGHVKKTIRKTLADPESAYRHSKDRDALNRILIYEKMKRR